MAEPKTIETESDWHERNDLASVLVEAALAGYAYAQDPSGTRWYGKHRARIDVTWENHAVDAKTGFIQTRNLGNGNETVLGFMGSTRENEVREGVTHYAIGVPQGGATVTVNADGSIDVSTVTVTLFLFPAQTLAKFKRPIRRDNMPGAGRNRYLPLKTAEQFRVLGPHLPSPEDAYTVS